MSDSSISTLGAQEPKLDLFEDLDVEAALAGLGNALQSNVMVDLETSRVIIGRFHFDFKPGFGICRIETRVEGETSPRYVQINTKAELLSAITFLDDPNIVDRFMIDDYDHDPENPNNPIYVPFFYGT